MVARKFAFITPIKKMSAAKFEHASHNVFTSMIAPSIGNISATVIVQSIYKKNFFMATTEYSATKRELKLD